MNIDSPFNENNVYTDDELKLVLNIYKEQMLKYRETCIRRNVKRARPLDSHTKFITELEDQMKRKAAKLRRAREVLDRITNTDSSPSASSSVSTMASDELFTPSPNDSPLTLKLKVSKRKTKSNNSCSIV